MKISNISVRNLEGLTASLDLLSVNFLVGANWSGKTTWLNAVRLALLGYLPERGKTNKATFGLSSGRDMEVTATFADGSRIRRRWYTKGDSVKTEEELPPAPMAHRGTAGGTCRPCDADCGNAAPARLRLHAGSCRAAGPIRSGSR